MLLRKQNVDMCEQYRKCKSCNWWCAILENHEMENHRPRCENPIVAPEITGRWMMP
jgi:hypothetical protein